ncbi:MAG: hypothetical protein HC804_14940 [Anaerolineae bacterium]|nr:hypothetical protein [Anaerolineae bacterium]
MTTKIAYTLEKQSPRSTRKNLIWVSPLAMLVSTVANLGLYAAAGRLFPEVTAWPGAGVGQIIGATIVYLLIGTMVFALITRFSARPAHHFLIVSIVGLLLSLALPISAAFGANAPGTEPATVATAVTLSLMHIVTFAISVPMFIRLALD